jgi:hypothetical protein
MKKTAVFILHAFVGWALCGLVMTAGMKWLSHQNALLVHLFLAPLIFALATLSYFRRDPGARPLPVAAGFTLIVMAADFILVAAIILKSFEMFRSFLGTWLPFAMIFISSWRTGASFKRETDPGGRSS